VVLLDGILRPRTGGSGSAGAVDIQAERLTLMAGAQINSTTFSTGQGGNITVAVREELTITGRDTNGVARSGIASATTTGSRGAGGRLSVTAPRVTLDDGFLTTQSQGAGDAGAVDMQVGTLTLSRGASVDSNTFGTGRGGTVTVQARESITLSGRSVDPDGTVRQSQIASRTTNRGGDAGRLAISAPSVTLGEDGLIRASTEGSGNAGSIAMDVGRLTLHAGGQISTSTTGAGQGGTVVIQAAEALTILGQSSTGTASALATTSAGTGSGGNVQIQARHLTLRQQGKIDADSTGEGDAGEIQIRVTETLRGQQGTISTASEQSGGGNIALDARLVHLTGSNISATVRGGTGGGGNISINAAFTVLNDSRVVAQADLGRGGNINITASKALLADPRSVVDASAQRGINGTVDLRSPVTNVSGTVAPLPQSFAPTAALLWERCAPRRAGNMASRFVLGGREGIPVEPDGMLVSRPPLAATASAASMGQELTTQPAVLHLLPSGEIQQVTLPTQALAFALDCARWSGQ